MVYQKLAFVMSKTFVEEEMSYPVLKHQLLDTLLFSFCGGCFVLLVFWFWISFLLGRLCSYDKGKEENADETD